MLRPLSFARSSRTGAVELEEPLRADLSVDAHGAWVTSVARSSSPKPGDSSSTSSAGRDLVALDHADRRTPVAAATPALLDALLEHRPSLVARN